MPLYQEPAVYVEEQRPLVTPIPSASTSIAGFVGVTERGPLRPQLMTNLGAFRRTYGGSLDRTALTNAGRTHHHLPEAVEGFFRNLGQVCWVVRVVPDSAARAELSLMDNGPAVGGQETRLLFGAPQGSGTALNQPLVYVLSDGLGVGDTIQIGLGSDAENHTVAAVADIATLTTDIGHIPLSNALARSVEMGWTVDELARAPDAGRFGASGGVFGLAEDADAGATELIIDVPDADGVILGDGTVPGTEGGADLIEIGGNNPVALFVRAVASIQVAPNQYRVTLAEPLPHGVPAGAGTLTALDPAGLAGAPGTLARNAAAGTTLLAVNDMGVAPNLRNPGDLIAIRNVANDIVAVSRIADVGTLALDWPLAATYVAGSEISLVATDQLARTAAGGGTATTFAVDSVEGLFAGMPITVALAGGDEDVTISAVNEGATEITVLPALSGAPAGGEDVTPNYQTTADVTEGTVQIAVNCRLGLDPVGDRRMLVEIGNPGDTMLAEAVDLPAPRGIAPDAGPIVLSVEVPRDYPAGTPVRVMTEPLVDAQAGRPQVLLDATEGDVELAVTGGVEFGLGDVVEVRTPGATRYHRLDANFDGAIQPMQVTLNGPLRRAQPAGAPVMERTPVLLIQARDQGSAGNRLRVSAAREESGLLSSSEITAQPAADQMRLETVNGVHPGTVLEIVDPATGAVQGPPVWVEAVDPASGNLVTLGANLQAANLPVVGRIARSVEYRITVFDTVRIPPGQPQPSNPVVGTEVFDNISLHPLHPRYAPNVIGDVAGDIDPLTGLTVGESRWIRVEDLSAPAAAMAVRNLATLTDVLPNGQERPARFPLFGGTDDAAQMNDNFYRGNVSNDPALRTGIEALRDARNVSMIACPGQTTVAVQSRLIQQCEELGDRFALLDLPEAARTLQAARQYRQNFDTAYAAMFYHWLMVADPELGATGSIPAPPSGHMAGIFARTDLQRGVFKAPANEVVMGITGLTETLTGTEHGLLNADAVQLNVIRRYEGRGTRLMGARNISSDPNERYVNVRRYVIFLTVSLEAGLQSMIFEPNDQRLWGRVTRSLTNFLTTQWRDGALMGSTPERAFSVRCGEDTMTPDDILNGRLIAEVAIAPVRPAEFIIIKLQKDNVGMGG